MIGYKFFLIDGIYFELTDVPEDKEYRVVIKQNEDVLYDVMLTKNMWAKVDRNYLSNYFVEIWDGDVCLEKSSMLDRLKGNRVFISFESSSLGDTIAWMPYCLEFKKRYGCDVIVSTFKNFLFEKVYPELEFVGRGVVVENIVAMLKLGWFWDEKMEPINPVTIPLQQAASNILHLPHEEIRPRIDYKPKLQLVKNYVTISTRSTAQCKHWYYWQELVNMLIAKGYEVVELSDEYDVLEGVIYPEDKSLGNVMDLLHHSQFFIGLSSGISWLSWAINKHVVMISNFTEANHEFTSNCTRIVNTKVCNGCWNNPKFIFDKGDWNWCPEHKGTDRQFECHKSITPQEVMYQIEKAGL